MPSIDESLQTALRHHQAGRVSEAEQIYRRVLHTDPQNVLALYLLGAIALQAGDSAQAIELNTTAVRLDANNAALQVNLGEAFRQAGRLEEARQSYLKAIGLDARLSQPHFYLGLVLEATGQRAAAEASYRRSLALNPRYAEAHYALGNLAREAASAAAALQHYQEALAARPDFFDALINASSVSRQCGRVDQARVYLQRAIALRPAAFEGYFLLGNLESACGDFVAAIANYEQAVRLNPNHAAAVARLGAAVQTQHRAAEAMACYRRAIELQPGLTEAHYNLGTALAEAGDRDAAMAEYQLTLRYDPQFAAAYVNIGAIIQDRGHDEQALPYFERAVQLDPQSAQPRFNIGLALLRRGELTAGWAGYQYRLRLPKFPVRILSEPLWDGAPIPEKTLLVHSEQGFGDTLQFMRYAPQIAERCARVLFRVQTPLVRLLTLSGFAPLYGDDDPLPAYDFQIPMLSVPGALGTTLANIPTELPYLCVPQELAEQWRERLATIPGFRVGIVWKGSPSNVYDRSRSIPLAEFAPLAQIDGVSLVSLQKHEGVEQLETAGVPAHRIQGPWDDTAGPFVDTTAILQNLDLLITCDTAIAHLAAALGTRVWVALATRADWRWMRDRQDTPWYPTMRLFRQTTADDWTTVFARIARELTIARDMKASGSETC